jgi:hypothetical protein
MDFFDAVLIDGEPRETSDGYLVFDARAARTGIQLYRGSEMGKPERDTVRVYRPADEVFSGDALRSFAFKPMTNDHPPEQVTADNWRKYSKGSIGGDIARDGECVRVPMVMMDKDAIAAYRAGKKELSAGYSCDIEWTEGKTESGEIYDAIQKNIRINHVAVVDAARGGPLLRIGDTNEKDKPMKTIMVDGLAVSIDDKDAQIVERHLAKLTSDVAAKDTEIATAKTDLADAKKSIETKDAEIATLKKQVEDAKVTPAQLDTMVKERSDVAAKASALLGDKLVTDGKTVGEMRRQVVDAKMGDTAKGWNDEQVAASFASLTADIKADGTDPLRTALGDRQVAGDKREDAYAARNKHLADAWKGAPAAA